MLDSVAFERGTGWRSWVLLPEDRMSGLATTRPIASQHETSDYILPAARSFRSVTTAHAARVTA